MRDLHEEVIAPHSLPVVRKAVLVPITVMLLHQNAFLDPPTMPRPQVTTLMHVLRTQEYAGDPRVASRLLHHRGRISIDRFPALLATTTCRICFLRSRSP